ncbi:hypothetical protein IWQ47_002910 [Aquimarina sp. EL_43]|uniref:DUF5916 domain-containing protein n=1 Tax=unclassified Aquimarina TaxID=2627091 RepID=UPI0018C99331|nr:MULTISPECIES: DUF5916 domain-containing protein [unclassified Aquimarina]MBG6131222.1 hypothetical protein [Aquimarina sp. EL_35]MBG6151896.1 hypothetical protein [Aquimarina sp. EL_32]MBG6169826.1 hypothetical protein [Aquimarina sp. EL_43]
MIRIALICCSILCCSHFFGQENTEIIIKKTNSKIILDGYVSDEEWKGNHTFLFHEFTPNWNQKDSLTTVQITFDDNFIYLGVHAKEPEPDKIINRNLLRDGWYGDDFIAFGIDPNQTKKNALVFSIYPSGSRYDMSISNDGIPLGDSTFNPSYDMIWEGKTQITEKGWSAEYKIPISNLRFVKKENQIKAGISVVRTQNHRNRSMRILPLPPQNIPNATETPSLYHPIVFDSLHPRKQLQITPYALGSVGSSYNFDTNEYRKQNDNNIEAGIDVRYGITPKLTLDISVNTDFAQVEIDDQIVNINDRVNVFLPEKRRFFQEQAGLFDFNAGVLSQLFYSRTIGINSGRLTPIIGGVRLTGQVRNADVGFLSLQTEGVNLGDEGSVSSENFSVLRFRNKVLNDKSFVGFMATNRLRKDYFNTAIGFDGVFSLPKSLYFIPSVSTTVEKDTNDYDLAENSRVSLVLDKRKQDGLFYRAAYEFSGKQYNPGMGFLLREKHHNLYGSLNYGNYNSNKDEALFQYTRWTLMNSDLYYTTDFSRVITWYNRSFWTGRLFNGDSFTVFGQVQYENLEKPIRFTNTLEAAIGDYMFYYFGASYSPGNRRNIQFPVGIEYGKFYEGTNLKLEIKPTINFGKHFNIESSWKANYIVFDKQNTEEWIHVIQTKFNWAYNLHLSGSIIGQYNSVSDQLLTSARLRYNVKDGHDIYLVYNQDYNIDRQLTTPNLPEYNNQIFTIKYLYTFFK